MEARDACGTMFSLRKGPSARALDTCNDIFSHRFTTLLFTLLPVRTTDLCCYIRTTYHVLRTTYYVLRATYYVLCTTYYVLRTTYYVLRTTYYVLRTTYYVPRAAYFALRTTYHGPRTTYHVLRTTYMRISFASMRHEPTRIRKGQEIPTDAKHADCT